MVLGTYATSLLNSESGETKCPLWGVARQSRQLGSFPTPDLYGGWMCLVGYMLRNCLS